MHEPSDKRYEEALSHLVTLGLTPTQARFYFSLLELGPTTARDISMNLKMHKVEVYRHLKQLSRMQLIEVLLGEPNKYVTVPPKLALGVMRSKLEDNFRNSVDKIERLSTILPKHSGALRAREAGGDPVYYRMHVGRQVAYEEIKRLFSQATRSIDRTATANGLRRSVFSGMLEEERTRAKHGVAVRLISTVSQTNLKEALEEMSAVKMRHLDDIQLRFGIIDGHKSFLAAASSDEDLSSSSSNDLFIFTNDPLFGRSLTNVFDNLWNNALDAGKIVQLLIRR